MQNALMRFPWFALAFAAYPLLYIAAVNPGQVEAPIVVLTAAAALIVALVSVALLRLPLGSWSSAGLGVAWLILLFFAYGPANEWWLDVVTAGAEQRSAGQRWYNRSPQVVHSIAWLALATVGLMLLRRHAGKAPTRLTSGLNLAAAVLVGFVALQAAWNFATGADQQAPRSAASRAGARASTNVPAPDIYFILLDGYARADILREYYDFDNAPFLDGLRRRGFQVSPTSSANYSWTFLSLGSALNMDYVQPLLGAELDPASRDRKAIYRLLRDHGVGALLRERGYRTVQLQSTWGGTASNPYVDEFLPCHAGMFSNEYLRAVADASWLRALESKASTDIATCHLRNFETLAAQAKAPGPKFVFAHFLPPHHPYLFDREGRVLRHANLSDQFEFQKRLWEDRSSYVDQLVFVNSRIDAIVDRLIADSRRPPIIVLFSDHGPNLRDGIRRHEQRRIRLANLTAILLPGAPVNLIPDDASPVNHLRRIFNQTFEAGLPLLPDRYFVSSYARPFEFVEVDAQGVELAPRTP